MLMISNEIQLFITSLIFLLVEHFLVLHKKFTEAALILMMLSNPVKYAFADNNIILASRGKPSVVASCS